ncbi:MAG: hypothetical protein AB7S72_12475 [Draconibacterium sp.]
MAVEKDFELMKLEYQFYGEKADLHYRAVESTMRLYFVLVAGFMSLIAYVYKDNFVNLQINRLNILILLITGVLFIIGLITYFKVAEHRLLLLNYIRSLNAVRSWFIDNSNLSKDYFLFSPDKKKPPYFRRFRHFYWELLGIATLNSFWALMLGKHSLNPVF